jgi:DNA-binding LacI/PurR family transcriptional regulator
VLSTSPAEEDEDTAYDRVAGGRRADGMIVLGAAATDLHAAQLTRAGFSVVRFGRSPLMPGVPSVSLDDEVGAYQATKHLIEVHGSRRPAHVSGPLRHQSAVDKRDGFVAALRDAGLSLDPRLQIEGDYTEESGWKAGHGLLGRIDSLDAVVCANDQMAMGLLQSLREGGVAAPGDVRVVGFDDHPLSSYLQPKLTTVGADFVHVGREAAHLLLRLLDGESGPAPHIVLPSRLVVRNSCGCESPPASG